MICVVLLNKVCVLCCYYVSFYLLIWCGCVVLMWVLFDVLLFGGLLLLKLVSMVLCKCVNFNELCWCGCGSVMLMMCVMWFGCGVIVMMWLLR